MKKIEKLNAQLAKVQAQINAISFERKDTSYRRSGGYYGTEKAITHDVIVIEEYARTKYLNTYVCVSKSNGEIAAKYKALKGEIAAEWARIERLSKIRWAKECIEVAKKTVEKDIKNGTINTNYAKMFIVGNRHIYYAHPYYQHADYNKSALMPNTPKHRKVAAQLNSILFSNGLVAN